MQVFIIGSPLETARALDKRRLNKQIIECKQILDALQGNEAWGNHPAVLQYRGHEQWLRHYMTCLNSVMCGADDIARIASNEADEVRPYWHCKDYYEQMKRRLYTKDTEHYKRWAHLGASDENWYWSDGVFIKYVDGKRV